MALKALTAQVARYAQQNRTTEKAIATPLPGLAVMHEEAPTSFDVMVYEPIACLILQGRKETDVGNRVVSVAAGDCVIVSHDLPVRARVTGASAKHPYLAIVLRLDVTILRSLHDQIGDAPETGQTDLAFQEAPAGPDLLDALARYFALVDDPVEAAVLRPLIEREIHFRLLRAPHGGMLRRLLYRDSHASRIFRAIERIRREYRAPLTVADLAGTAGMSASSFHEHFRAVTATTPLQFQKDLRLTEARRLLADEGRPVSLAAYDVGYESPTQFSREYARKFGVPPRTHLARQVATA